MHLDSRAREQQRRAIEDVAEALQRIMPGIAVPDDQHEVPQGSTLVKFSVVTEWLEPDNEETKITSSIERDFSDKKVAWEMALLLYGAMNGDWD